MPEFSPFQVGDSVLYTPSPKDYDSGVMGDRLQPGERYNVESIDSDVYITVNGYTHPGGGLHWTEFSSADRKA